MNRLASIFGKKYRLTAHPYGQSLFISMKSLLEFLMVVLVSEQARSIVDWQLIIKVSSDIRVYTLVALVGVDQTWNGKKFRRRSVLKSLGM
jgi:hypothetical protein